MILIKYLKDLKTGGVPLSKMTGPLFGSQKAATVFLTELHQESVFLIMASNTV